MIGTWWKSTENSVDVFCFEELHIFSLVEKVFVDPTSSKKPYITIVCYGSLSKADFIQKSTLCFSFHRSNKIRNSKEP